MLAKINTAVEVHMADLTIRDKKGCGVPRGGTLRDFEIQAWSRKGQEVGDFPHFYCDLCAQAFYCIGLKTNKSVINPFPNKPWVLRACSRSLLKTLWEKEKFLVPSNFSFAQSIFHHFNALSAIFIKFEVVVCKLSVW